MEMIEKVQQAYKEKYKEDAAKLFFSPGRVNLIGEHTDYNGGHVFPCAISLGHMPRRHRGQIKKYAAIRLTFRTRV